MGNRIIGRPKQVTPPPPELMTTAPSLQEQITVLEKRKMHLERLIEINHQKARESKTKDEAYRYLKLKANYEKELKSLFGILDKLEGLDEPFENPVPVPVKQPEILAFPEVSQQKPSQMEKELRMLATD